MKLGDLKRQVKAGDVVYIRYNEPLFPNAMIVRAVDDNMYIKGDEKSGVMVDSLFIPERSDLRTYTTSTISHILSDREIVVGLLESIQGKHDEYWESDPYVIYEYVQIALDNLRGANRNIPELDVIERSLKNK